MTARNWVIPSVLVGVIVGATAQWLLDGRPSGLAPSGPPSADPAQLVTLDGADGRSRTYRVTSEQFTAIEIYLSGNRVPMLEYRTP